MFLQELVAEKEHGNDKLIQAVDSGEKLYPNTAADGREMIRHELRLLKQDWDSLYDDVMAAQRQLNVNVVQWTSFEESYDKLEVWLKATEAQLKGDIPLKATLDDKKSQLSTYRVSTNGSTSH